MQKLISYSLLLLLLVASPTLASEKTDAEHALQNNMNQVIHILQNQDLSLTQKKENILQVVTPAFDFSLMAKLAMGKKYWSQLTSSQKKRYILIFTDRLRRSYVDKLELYSNEKVVYRPSRLHHGKVYIPTDLVSADKSITMLYKLYRRGTDWRIYDVEIQGVSIIKNYRSQISQILKNGTVDDLFKKLKN